MAESERDLKPGDVVRHRSGGPRMVIRPDAPTAEGVVCELGSGRQCRFPLAALELAPPPPTLPSIWRGWPARGE